MDADASRKRLSDISTRWSLVVRAHGEPGDEATRARQRLMERYTGAVQRYLLAALRDPDVADDAFQEFALRFLRGGFRNADPQRGRFRDFVKTAVYHLILDVRKRQRGAARSLDPDLHPPAVEPPSQSEDDQQFLESWRQELFERAWVALQDVEARTGQPCYTLLRMRADQPTLSSEELARQLGERLGKAFTVEALRQALYRAREKFTDLLLREVEQSLDAPSADALMEELTDLGLLPYCQGALRRRGL